MIPLYLASTPRLFIFLTTNEHIATPSNSTAKRKISISEPLPTNEGANTMASPSSSSSSREDVSVMDQIFAAAGGAPFNLTDDEIDKKVWDIYEDICRHSSIRGQGSLDEEGKKWLTELLAWEMFCPNDKDGFPGIPPSSTSTSSPRPLDPNTLLPFCQCCACLGWKQGTRLCSFIRTTKCQSGHSFKYRIGSEINCPECRDNEMISSWTFIHQIEPKETTIQEDDWIAVDKEWSALNVVEYEDDPDAKRMRRIRASATYCIRGRHNNKKSDFDPRKRREEDMLKQKERRKKREENIFLRKAKRELFGIVLKEA